MEHIILAQHISIEIWQFIVTLLVLGVAAIGIVIKILRMPSHQQEPVADGPSFKSVSEMIQSEKQDRQREIDNLMTNARDSWKAIRRNTTAIGEVNTNVARLTAMNEAQNDRIKIIGKKTTAIFNKMKITIEEAEAVDNDS